MTETVQTSLIVAGSAIVGGLIATASSLALHILESREKRKEARRAKLEHLAELMEGTIQWYRELSRSRTLRELDERGGCPPIREARTLATIYFPSLRAPISELSNTFIDLHHVMVDAFNPTEPSLEFSASAGEVPEHMVMMAGAQVVKYNEPQFRKLRDASMQQRNAIEEQIGEIARQLR